MAKRWFDGGDDGLVYWVWDTETGRAQWVYKSNFEVSHNSGIGLAQNTYPEIPDPRPARYVRWKDRTTGKAAPWPDRSTDYIKIEGDKATLFHTSGTSDEYPLGITEEFLTKGLWVEVPKEEIFPRYFKWVGKNHGIPMLWVIEPGHKYSKVYTADKKGEDFSGCHLEELTDNPNVAEIFHDTLEAALADALPPQKDRFFRTKQGEPRLWHVAAGQDKAKIYAKRKVQAFGECLDLLVAPDAKNVVEFFPASLDAALDACFGPEKDRYFRTTDAEPWMWVVKAGEQRGTCYRSRKDEPWPDNNHLDTITQNVTEFFPASLEDAFNILWPLKKDRYFKCKDGCKALWYAPVSKDGSIYYDARDHSVNGLSLTMFLSQCPNVEEFFPASLDEALDAVWPKKTRYFRTKKGSPRLWYVPQSGGTYFYASRSEAAIESGLSLQQILAHPDTEEFFPGSFDAALDAIWPRPDTNVLAVAKKLQDRSAVGIKKYGVTTERTDIDQRGWLNHLQEELLDAAVYVERLMKELPSNGCKKAA